MVMKAREFRSMLKSDGLPAVVENMATCLAKGRRGEPGGMTGNDFSLAEIAEGTLGHEFVAACNPKYTMEAGDATDSTAFSNITGQLLINELLMGFENAQFVITSLFRTVATRLSGEKIPGIAKLGDTTEEVAEGMPYPRATLGEDWITSPATKKHGTIVPVTREAIFFDRTGVLLDNARTVGTSLGLDKEKRCVDVFIGAVNNHSWKDTAYNTYQAATPWINTLSGAGYDLTDWEQIDSAMQVFNDMTDPNTGEPIIVNGSQVVACPAKAATLNRLRTATEVRNVSGDNTVLFGNPTAGIDYRTSVYLYSRLQSQLSLSAGDAAATWFYGDPSTAFAYMENWPITVTEAPQNSMAAFEQDIVAQYRASERGVPFAKQPRAIIRVSGHA